MLGMWLQFSGGGLASYGQLLLPIAFFGLLYFLMIKPNQDKQKKWQTMLGELKSGDKIVTSGGLKGTVLSVKDDAVVLRLPPDGLKVEVVKSSIASVTTADGA